MSDNLGLILHHAVANGSLFNFFNSSSAQVSAHFWVSKSGVIEQYVDSEVVAWHAKQLNGRYCGVETEGCTQGPAYAEPMTNEMEQGLARIYAEGAARHGWANALINTDGQRGFGYHRMAVNTACPCDIRLNRRQAILDRAFGPGPQPEPEPPKPKPEELADMLIAPTFYWTDQYHIFSLSKVFGNLWHKVSSDGVKWHDECLMGPGGTGSVVNTGKKLVEITSAVPEGQMAIVTMLDEDSMVWICRWNVAQRNWDRRKISG